MGTQELVLGTGYRCAVGLVATVHTVPVAVTVVRQRDAESVCTSELSAVACWEICQHKGTYIVGRETIGLLSSPTKQTETVRMLFRISNYCGETWMIYWIGNISQLESPDCDRKLSSLISYCVLLSDHFLILSDRFPCKSLTYRQNAERQNKRWVKGLPPF